MNSMFKVDVPAFSLPSPISAGFSLSQKEAFHKTRQNSTVIEQSKAGHDELNMTLDEARLDIHQKIPYGSACWPCRLRKVKCERKRPCENCITRDHSQLCAYQPKRSTKSTVKRPLHDPSTSRPERTAGKGSCAGTGWSRPQITQRPIKSLDLSRNLKKSSGLAKQAVDIYLEPTNITFQKRIEKSDTSPPELPSDYEILRLFQTYKEIPHVFGEFLMDIDDMELKVLDYVDKRCKTPRQSEIGTSSWLALFYSILAVGAQYQESPHHIRYELSNRYTQGAFYFLHLNNALRKPKFEHIQALLLLSFVLLNNTEVNSSRAILDLISILARSMGLHHEANDDRETKESLVDEGNRRRLWWNYLQHRSLISQFCGNCLFDSNTLALNPNQSINGPGGACASHPITFTVASTPNSWTYLEAMCHTLQGLEQRSSSDPLHRTDLSQVLASCEMFESIIDKLAPYLRNQALCKTANDYLQYYSVHLHISFSISMCCRPILWRASEGYLGSLQQQLLVDKCRENLERTIEMFLAMNRLSIIPMRSWTFIQAALSSALLLGKITEDNADPGVRQLLDDLILAFSDTATGEQYFAPSSIQYTGNVILSSMANSLDSLKDLFKYFSLSISNGKQSSEAKATPSDTGLISPASSNQTNYTLELDDLLQPEKSPARAMAEKVDEYLIYPGHDVSMLEDIYQTTLDTVSLYNP